MKLTFIGQKGKQYVALISPQSSNEFLASGGTITIDVGGQKVSRYSKNAVRSLKDKTVANNLKKLKKM